MAEAKNTTPSKPIVRTYGGVQWFKHEHGWRASIPGTPISVNRFSEPHIIPGHHLEVEIWCTVFGGHWTLIGSSPPLSTHRGGSDFFNHHDMMHYELPWKRMLVPSVAKASEAVMEIRDRVAELKSDGW